MKRLLVLAVLLACGDVTPPPAGGAPVNSCQGQSDCEKFLVMGATCSKDGICVAPAKLSYTLVVTIPTTSNYAPGETIFLPPAYLNDLFAKQKVMSGCADQDTRPQCNCIAPKCLFLPLNGEEQGTFKVDRSVAVQHWPWEGCGSSALSQSDKDKVCGLRPADLKDSFTSIPSRVVYRPLWPVDTSFSFASSVGIPIQEIEAKLLVRQDAAPGPNNTTGTRYDVLLQAGPPSTTGVGWYVRRADPMPPFDSAFPPALAPLQVGSPQGGPSYNEISIAFDPKPEVRTFTLTTKGPSLAGWRVYLAARSAASSAFGFPVVDGERVSTVTTIADPSGQTVTLNTALSSSTMPVDNVAGMRLVIEPPTGQAYPVFSIDDVTGQILPTTQEYPALPPPVLVAGSTTLDGSGRQSRVTFETLHDPDGAIELADGTFSLALSYRTMIETDATGAYSVHLPPGKYGVYVEPLVADSAKTIIPFKVGSTEPIQQGRALALWSKTHVRGTVVLGDNRLVGGAEVTFLPALQPPMGTNPLSLPRPALARTVIADNVAAFDVDVDPGVYDITVAPLAGTKFPWVVQTTQLIPQMPDLQIDPAIIPPPIQQGGVVPGLTIRDPSGNAVAGALVEVYAAAQPSAGALYLIGRVMTDVNGHIDLYLAGAPK